MRHGLQHQHFLQQQGNRLDTIADFTWNFGQEFFLETSDGNFVWSDPDYGGDNTIRPANGTYKQWIGGNFGRCKGRHSIRDYCGPDVQFLDK